MFSPPPPSEITPPQIFATRRRLLLAGASLLSGARLVEAKAEAKSPKLSFQPNHSWPIDDPVTPFSTTSTYNNFYEFGPDKDSPHKNAKNFRTDPWHVQVEGEVLKPQTFALEDMLRWGLEERIYRLRCVEGWSAVIPWIGFPLSTLIKKVEPTGKAKFVEFISLADPEQMPAVRLPLLQWPYNEGLRMDEASNPLTLLAVGMYGNALPPQNGAPIRLVVPWKYGFKSAKSIVRIRFTEQQPRTAWVKAAPHEYGFFANVNPDVPHRRWSQATERRLGEFRKRPTLPFNGYAEQVAHLYNGMDLRRNY